MKWLGSDGPLILLSEDSAPRWRGVSMTDLDEDSDYERVCRATDDHRAAVVAFDGGTALALDTTGHQAAWRGSGDGAMVIKWCAADSERDITDRLRGDLDELDWERQCEWRATARVLLAEAGNPGGGDDAIPGPLRAGLYAVDHASASGPRMSVELFRLSRLRS